MIAAFTLLLIGAAASGPRQEPDLRDRAEVQVLLSDPEPYVGEVVEVRVRFLLRRDFLRRNLVQSFRKKLDAPVQVRAPWWTELAGARILGDERSGDRSMVLNGQLSAAHAISGGRVGFDTFEIRTRVLCERPGTLTFAPATLAFEFAEGFEENFLGDRVPVGAKKVTLESRSERLEVRDWPIAGRPAGFSGAVGDFTVRASLPSQPTGIVGEPLQWVLAIETAGTGPNNLLYFDAPAFGAELADFHVRGRIEERSSGVRAFVHELVPLRVLTEIPPVSFTFFDPDRERYETVRSDALAIDVQPSPDGIEVIEPAAPAVAEVSADEADERPIVQRSGIGALMNQERLSLPRTERIGGLPLASVLGAPWLLWIATVLFARWRARGREDAATLRARMARQHFEEALERDPEAVSEAFAEYLGAKLRCPAAAVVDADLEKRLLQAQVPETLAREAAGRLQQLVDEHFTRSATSTPRTVLGETVDRLEAVFAAEEEGA